MILTYVFFGAHLVFLSWIADRYHKHLRKTHNVQMALKHPHAKKEILWREKEAATLTLKKHKKSSYLILVGLTFIHQITGVITAYIGSNTREDLNAYYYSPLIGLVLSCVILTIIYWLKGKGGGVPGNRAIEEF